MCRLFRLRAPKNMQLPYECARRAHNSRFFGNVSAGAGAGVGARNSEKKKTINRENIFGCSTEHTLIRPIGTGHTRMLIICCEH